MTVDDSFRLMRARVRRSAYQLAQCARPELGEKANLLLRELMCDFDGGEREVKAEIDALFSKGDPF